MWFFFFNNKFQDHLNRNLFIFLYIYYYINKYTYIIIWNYNLYIQLQLQLYKHLFANISIIVYLKIIGKSLKIKKNDFDFLPMYYKYLKNFYDTVRECYSFIFTHHYLQQHKNIYLNFFFIYTYDEYRFLLKWLNECLLSCFPFFYLRLNFIMN